MTRRPRALLIGLAVAALAGSSVLALILSPGLRASLFGPDFGDDTYTVEVTDYAPPAVDEIPLADDRIGDKKTVFDPALVDRRPLEGWSLNASEAVLRLDLPMIKPDQNPERLVLHPSYASAVKEARGQVLPSVNMIDGKAKQFDDGLYAAIDQAYYSGRGESMKSHLATIRRISAKVSPGTPAADYLAAGLSLGDERVGLSPRAKALASAFRSREVLSKPIGFYTWNKTLSDCFRVLRYFSRPIADRSIPPEIARVLKEDDGLRADYLKAYTFYAGLTNPLDSRTPLDLIGGPPLGPTERVSLFPPSTSRETELFEKLFPIGLPSGADLMRELIAAIRSGKVDLKPRANGGWYDYQVHALETMLLPERGEEANKLLLTKAYKKRMLEAFKALITKRRETHVREAKTAEAKFEMPIPELSSVRPRLRVEPNPTYYLRTARAYAFLAGFLDSTIGESSMKSLRGLRESGEREADLHTELRSIRDLFYGLYLLSAEDIGLKAAFLDAEPVDREAAEKLTGDWLAKLAEDRDLAADTRVATPIYDDPQTGKVRLWMTIGVRLSALDVGYARAPSIRPLDGPADWKPVESYKLESVQYLIPVDEFAEVEIGGSRVLTRAELRAVCDRMKTREKIIEALRK